jgi:biopolymer transport protein ExbB
VIRALLVLLACIVGAAAAETDLAAGASDAQRQAESQLKDVRTRILTERAELSRELAEAYQHLDEARADAAVAAQDRAAAEEGLRRQRSTAALDEQTLRGAVAQLYAAARLEPPASTPDDAALAKAAGGIAARAADLPARLAFRLGTEEILDRDGLPTRAPVLRLGAFAGVALGDDDRTCGLLAATSSGRGMVSGPPLPPSARLHAGALPSTALIAVDVDGTLARSRPVSRGLGEWFASGGPFMWAILAVGLAGLVIIVERAGWFARARTGEEEARMLIAAAARGEPAARPPRRPLERVLAAALGAVGAQRESAIERAALAEEPGLERGLTILAALAGAAPLLGLLGTVTGMIGMFATLAEHGSGNPRLLSSHISIALVTTQFGLMVAVPLLVAHAVIARLRERQALLIEQAASALGLRPRVEPQAGRYSTELEQVKP